MLLLNISGLILISYKNFLQNFFSHMYNEVRCLSSASWNRSVLRYSCLLVGEVRDWVSKRQPPTCAHKAESQNHLYLKISTPDFPNKQTDSSLHRIGVTFKGFFIWRYTTKLWTCRDCHAHSMKPLQKQADET